jgi:hypothetical protein
MCPKPMEKLETVLATVVEPMVFLETVLETVAKPMEKLETVRSLLNNNNCIAFSL